MMFYIQSVLGLQFLGFTVFYCYIVDPGSYLENTDNHQTKHSKKEIFKEKGTLYFAVFLEKKTTFS